jgi:hypothetical protein
MYIPNTFVSGFFSHVFYFCFVHRIWKVQKLLKICTRSDVKKVLYKIVSFRFDHKKIMADLSILISNWSIYKKKNMPDLDSLGILVSNWPIYKTMFSSLPKTAYGMQLSTWWKSGMPYIYGKVKSIVILGH